MNLPKITIGLVLTRNLGHLEYSIGTLLEQKFDGEIEFYIRDQSKRFEISEYLNARFEEKMRRKNVIIEKAFNSYHSGGHNKIIEKMTGKYYVCLSQNSIYSPHFLQELVTVMEQNPEYGFGTPKVKKWNFRRKKMTNIIGSLGIGMARGQDFFHRGYGKRDKEIYNKIQEVFGGSNAGIIFRRSALEKIEHGGEYFDSLLQKKDDVDISYRLRWVGEKCLLIPKALMWQDYKGPENIFRSRKEKSNSLYGLRVLITKNFSKYFSHSEKFAKNYKSIIRDCMSFFIAPEALERYFQSRKLIYQKKNRIKRIVPPIAIEALIEKKW